MKGEKENLRRQVMVIRPIKNKDAESLFDMMCILDNETPFMMYEPDERKKQRI